MRQILQEQLEQMDLAAAEAERSNRVYEAACFLEHAGEGNSEKDLTNGVAHVSVQKAA